MDIQMVAATVGRRRGAPVVLIVEAERMSQDGRQTSWCAENGVWLVEFVPAEYLTVDRSPAVGRSHE